jgi:predicted O-linked N-acetylglucosamine transferase (SPINDLY family)
VTFGSFNIITKVTTEVIACWANLLQQVPNARLMLKNKSFSDAAARKRYEAHFAAHGIAPERLELLGWIPNLTSHLALYSQIDIALDTFPYHGTTTTCQALWMGVPVITLAGATHAGRVGVSLLTRVGLPELIADSEDDYIHRATALARDLPRLTELRASLRQRMAQSPLCDGKAFARDVEAAYREMWREWCANHPKT